MRDAEEIMKAAVAYNEIPEGYNLVEAEAFNAMRQLVLMFKKGEISKELATKNRERVYAEYNKEARDFEFVYKLYSDHTHRVVKDTEMNRTKLRKMLQGKDKKLEENDFIEALKVSLDIIETVFPGEITGMNSEIPGFPEGGF
jgi:hypothetical protein